MFDLRWIQSKQSTNSMNLFVKLTFHTRTHKAVRGFNIYFIPLFRTPFWTTASSAKFLCKQGRLHSNNFWTTPNFSVPHRQQLCKIVIWKTTNNSTVVDRFLAGALAT